ncbi:MAG: nickel-type superoxide dismutase maturation protease [Chloroflexota bacterium]|nr:nickel-type superoxide dismutase maturation protease [Chloroflexota bacterium]
MNSLLFLGGWTLRAQPVYTDGVPVLPSWPPVVRFVVADGSMQPALQPGDRVLVSRWTRPRIGHIVVLRDPHTPWRFLIKRVASRTDDGRLVVVGDNPTASRDSRAFGAVPLELVVGRAVYRYLPGERRGQV